MEHTQIINAMELESYAETINSEAVVPELVWLLVNETVNDLTNCRIPYGDVINQPGWDGLVQTEHGFRQFVPKGKSFWEIGTGASPQDKATADFRKRTDSMTPEERKDATYLFVTPRGASAGGWNEPAQSTWIKARKDEGWKDLKILDAIQLADWLREKPAIGKWLLKKIGLVKTSAGFSTPAEHWDNLQQLARHGDPLLPEAIFLVGRDQACIEMARLFRGQIRELVVRVESELDVEDFVAAFLAKLDANSRRSFSYRCLFIKDADAWLSMANLKTPHVLVAHPILDLESSGEQLHIAARNHGHCVIIPVSVGSTAGGGDLIPLRSPSASSLENALAEAGYSRERARELAAAGALSLAALKRHLRGLGTVAPYAKWDSARELALAGLIGRWFGENPADRAAMEILLGKSYGEWIEIVRPETLRLDTPLIQRNENWKVISRGEAWSALGHQLTNADLDRFHKAALVILGERDPKFDLPPDDRYAATIHGKVLLHSSSLRRGIAESLALLGSRPTPLFSTSQGKAELTAFLTVQKLLKNADWVLWASLDDCLPLLAESAPDAFLEAVEASLLDPAKSPFREVFAQEGSGLMGSSHSTGLLWALETLAWHPDHLMRVSVLLAELASIDPGGTWANRPTNSLHDIFLPWHPQTCAAISKRKAAVEAVLREQPGIGWKLVIGLLPSMHGATSGTRKPAWRDFIPIDWSEGVSKAEYWDQVKGYAEIAVSTAATDISKLAHLIDRLPDLPEPAYNRVLEHLTSQSVLGLSEPDRSPLWDALVDLAAKHRKFADANWAMPLASVAKIEAVAANLAPKLPSVLYRRLFSEREFDLLEEAGDFEAQERNLEHRRESAVTEILNTNRLIGVLEFAKQVASPEKVGFALGRLDVESADALLLPDYLGGADKALSAFIAGYVCGRFWSKSWPWVDAVASTNWAAEHKCTFFALLPFVEDTWRRAEHLLGNEVTSYWRKVRANPWQPKEQLLAAAEKLLQYDRPRDALACLNRLVQQKRVFPPELAVRALMESVAHDPDASSLDHHMVTGIITWLQENSETNKDSLFQVEWTFLPFLDHHFGGGPKILDRRLADDSTFFCEVIKIVFRSEKDNHISQPPTEAERNFAQNAYRLFHVWRTLPGQTANGSLDTSAFGKWVTEVKQSTTSSGHFGIAMVQVGKVLAYAPKDPAGLWIHHSVAEALNAKDTEDMRSGFTCELFNMRGAYATSGSGKEELEMAAFYRDKAEALEQHGFQRLAAAVRRLAETYESAAQREVSRDPYEH